MEICARNSEDLDRVVQEARHQGVNSCGVIADVGREEDIERFVDEAAAEFGRVDLLVANAGPHLGGRLVTSTPDDWRKAFELHVIHAARAIRACVPHMQQAGGGAVVIIASISGWKPAPRPQYGAAKAAEIYLAMELGRELAPEGIRVNAVSPGSILFPGGGWDFLRERDPERVERFIERDFAVRGGSHRFRRTKSVTHLRLGKRADGQYRSLVSTSVELTTTFDSVLRLY